MPAKKYFTPEAVKAAALENKKRYNSMNREKNRIQARIRYKHNIEKENIRNRKYYAENTEKRLLSCKKSREKNIDRIRKRDRESATKNRLERLAYNREWRRRNPEKVKARSKRWSKENHFKVLAYNASVRARKRRQLHPSANKKTMAMMYGESKAIALRTGVPHHVDHIIPLAAGGWHHEENMQPLVNHLNHNNREKGGKGSDPFWISPSIDIKDWRDVPRNLWPIDLVPKYLALLEKHKGESIRWDTAA